MVLYFDIVLGCERWSCTLTLCWDVKGGPVLSFSDTFLKIYSVEEKRQIRSVSLSNMVREQYNYLTKPIV